MLAADENSLLAAACAGDDDALGRLLCQYDLTLRGKLTERLGRRMRPAIDICDVLQITYLEAFLRIRDFQRDGPGAFAGWLERIAENNLLDALRSLRRAKRPPPGRKIPLDGGEDSHVRLLEDLAVTQSTPSQCLTGLEARRLLVEVVAKLPPDYRTVVNLCDLEGRSAAQAAGVMNRSVAAIYMLRARAHDHLRALLARHSAFASQVVSEA